MLKLAQWAQSSTWLSRWPAGWDFWNNHYYRTLKGLAPLIKVQRGGVYHNALDDAKTQAAHALEVFKHLRGVK